MIRIEPSRQSEGLRICAFTSLFLRFENWSIAESPNYMRSPSAFSFKDNLFVICALYVHHFTRAQRAQCARRSCAGAQISGGNRMRMLRRVKRPPESRKIGEREIVYRGIVQRDVGFSTNAAKDWQNCFGSVCIFLIRPVICVRFESIKE